MRGNGIADEDDRQRALEEHRQEIEGRLPKGPFEFSDDLEFSDLDPKDDDSDVVSRFKRAVQRDARYSVGSAVYLSLFGMSQGLRHIYDGGGQIQDGEANESD